MCARWWSILAFQLLIVLLPDKASVQCLDPLTGGFAAGVAAVFGYGYIGPKFGCWARPWTECCTTPWIKHNVTDFEESFDNNVFGQHIARQVITTALKSHLRRVGQDGGPKKALVLSFHGQTGSGKNYVAKFVADSLFSKGLSSNFAQHFIGPHHFPQSQDPEIHRLHVIDWIRSNVTACGQSLFIFDEVDKMDAKILDGIKPFIDSHEQIDGVDYRKSVFVFLSNSGSKSIMREAIRLWQQGVKREQITLSDLENALQLGAYNEKGGLQHSELLVHHLVDYLVPFLPLERSHVRQCAVVDLVRALQANDIECGYVEKMAESVVSTMVFGPEDSKLYSSTGCKRVGNKVNEIVETIIEDLDSEIVSTNFKCRRRSTE